jgi:serine/threonine protein kinase
MLFRPAAFAGRPLPELVAALNRLDPGSLSTADVRLFDGRTTVATAGGDARLPADHPDVDIPGIILDQYLGGGGQGCVYSGRITATGKLVAVKLLSHGRAVREALLAGRVRHPNVLRVLRAQPAGHYWVVLMELVQGTELGHTRPNDLRGCFIRLADALHAVAAARLVHRDVKPANVLLRSPDAAPVLVDFGLAVDLGSGDEEDAEVSGTPLFLPPEAWRDARPDPAWDAYALGITAATVLGVTLPICEGVGSLRPVKLDGRYDREVSAGLESLKDRRIADWARELIRPEPSRRMAALKSTGDWLAA